MTAQQAIDRSISHDEIVALDADEDAHEYLLERCDESVEANGVIEYWGSEPDPWRVHVRLEA